MTYYSVTYRAPTACPDTVRQAHPDALIIRHLAQGGYVAFCTADDARGHSTAVAAPFGDFNEHGQYRESMQHPWHPVSSLPVYSDERIAA
jgi:hypothetical protein